MSPTPAVWAVALAAVLCAAAVLPARRLGRVPELTAAGRLGLPPGSEESASNGSAPRAARRGGGARPARLIAGLAAGGVVLGVLLVRGVALAVAAAAVCGAAWVLVRDVRRARAATADRRELSSALHVLVGELEAGAQAADALRAAATVASAESGPARWFATAAEVAAVGGDAGAVLVAAGQPGLRGVGLAWQLGAPTGTALSGVLARVVADLAAADEQRRATAIALAGPRSSASVLALLPVLGVLLGMAMGASPLRFLTGAPAGQALCCAGVLLDVGGVLWLRAILRRAVRE
ncbi:MAG TPA: hypothetical protein VFH38_08760 [Jatrophihabitans sp.]|nr:hypothetical protein [Jatrophihabitans sp.]